VELAHKRVLIIGLGVSGSAAARGLAARGASLVMTDQRQDIARASLPAGDIYLGAEDPGALRGVDFVVPSPGVPPSSMLLGAARAAGIPIIGELELASRLIKAPIIAVTGTNGKSTVTTLLGEVCKAAQALGLKAVTGMHPENPGTLSYPSELLIVPTAATSVDMPTALAAMVRLALKLSRGEELGPAQVEGYLPRGLRRVYDRQRPGYLRALDMLQAKLQGEAFVTEVPIHAPERVTPAAPIADLSRATIALVTTGGLVRKGNPDKQVASNATRYYRHTVAELRSLSGNDWEAYHSGYFNHIVNVNPNYILPLNFLRDLEDEGAIGGVYQWIYALPGVSTPVAISKRLGKSIAEDLQAGGINGCLLVAT